MDLINFDGLTCEWYCQPMDNIKANNINAKEIRTKAVKEMFPQFVKDSRNA